MMFSVTGLLLCYVIASVNGHGRLIKPPARSSMWRVGFDTPKNYNDNQLNCGGFMNQYLYQGGKCGVCGDPNQGPRDNEAGGRFATGTIGKTYRTGEIIDVTVEITADHRGWFAFQLCPNNNPSKKVTEECFSQYPLDVVGSGKKFMNPGGTGARRLRVKLPDGVQCSQCVLRWKWHAGNNYGVDPNGKGCVGCGPQEEFYGCADIAINTNGISNNQNPTPNIGQPTRPITYRPVIVQQTTPKPFTFRPIVTFQPFKTNAPMTQRPFITNAPLFTLGPIRTNAPTRPSTGLVCKAINYWKGVESLDQWCTVECRKGNCPASACECQNGL